MRRCLVVSVLVLAACGGPSFAESDPNGAKTRGALVAYMQSSDDMERFGYSMEAGKYARAAESADVKAAAEHLAEGINLADLEALQTACEAHGVTVPQSVEVIPAPSAT